MLLAAARFMPSPMDTTFLMTGASVQVAAAKPAVATPAVGSTFCRMTGFAGTAAKALEAGLAICSCNNILETATSQCLLRQKLFRLYATRSAGANAEKH